MTLESHGRESVVSEQDDEFEAAGNSMSSWSERHDSQSLDIYKVDNQRHPSDYYKQKIYQIKQQKIWVTVHTIFLLGISIISFFLLHTKSARLHSFYQSPQCCYCLWVGNNQSISKHHEIEWSACTNSKKVNVFSDGYNACNYNDTIHCNITTNYHWDKSSDWYQDQYSASSSVFIWKFPKYYPYYGILSIVLVSGYVSFLIIVTFCYEIPLSVQLFIGNIVVSINTLYTYIKLYQYAQYDYAENAGKDAQCPAIDKPILNTTCYRNVLPPEMEFVMHLLVYFVYIYAVYPFIFCVFFRCCSRIHFCGTLRSKLEKCLLYLGIIGGIFFLFMGFALLTYIMCIDKGTDFELIHFLTPSGEKGFIAFLTIFLLLFTIDVFLLEHCRTRSSFMVNRWLRKKSNVAPYLLLNESSSEQANE